MELDTWSDDDFKAMKEIERELIDLLIPRVQHVSPLLALYALIRCARVMLRKGDEDAQRAILPVIKAYLDGQVSFASGSRLLWTPDERKH
jgi:hypothetical protein